MPSVTRPGGVSIYFEAEGAGPAIALAHGFGVSLEMWDPQRRALAQRHRLVLWDARGHGYSGAPREPEAYSMPLFAEDLRAVLVAEGAEEGAVIGGMSFGGQIALQYAVDYPESTPALILSDSAPRGAGESSIIPTRTDGAFLAMVTRSDLTPALPSLTMPALVIYGEGDTRLHESVRVLAEGLPQRRVVCMTGCVHGTSSQRPEDWTAAVLRFLDDIEAGRPVTGEETV
jgi:pimeloyl-ACP methyl ester carboxylesterase